MNRNIILRFQLLAHQLLCVHYGIALSDTGLCDDAADMPALKRWIKAEDGIPDWQTVIAQSVHLLLAGCAGILKPVKPIDFPPLPALTSHGETGIVSRGNIAFTYWVELLMTAPDLDAACCQ